MTARTDAADRGFLAGAVAPIRWLAEFMRNLAEYQAGARAMAELNAMSERDLADIGVNRHSIREFVGHRG